MNAANAPDGAAEPEVGEKGYATDVDHRLFLCAEEVGRQLGLGRSRVYELAACGMLPVVRLGRRMLFPRRGLEALAQAAIERAKAGPPAGPAQRGR